LAIVANAIPLAGVMFWGWDLVNVFVLYWLETIIIAVFSLLKMACVPTGIFARLKAVIGFAVVFTVLSGFYGMAIIGMLAAPRTFPEALADQWAHWPALLAACAALALEHGDEFARKFLAGGGRRAASLDDLYLPPILRLIWLHLSLCLGGFIINAYLPGMGPLIWLIAIKTACDMPDTVAGMTIRGGMITGAIAGATACVGSMLVLLFPAAVIASIFPAAKNLVLVAFIGMFLLTCASAIGGALYIIFPSMKMKHTAAISIAAVALLAFAMDIHKWRVEIPGESTPKPSPTGAPAAAATIEAPDATSK
jgi:hypothetical protein